MFATYDFVSLVNGPFVCLLVCVSSEVKKANGNVWIPLVDFFVIGIGEFVVLGVVVLVVSVVVFVRSSVVLNVVMSVDVVVGFVVVVIGFVVVVSGMYT